MAEVKLVISGDVASAKRAVAEAVVGLEDLQVAGQKVTASTEKANKAAERYIEALRRQAVEVAGGEQALRAYEMAQLGLTEGYRKQITGLHQTIDAHKAAAEAARRHGDLAERLGRQLGNLANAAATAASSFAVMITKASVNAAMEAEQSQLRLEAVIRATGHAAGWTRAQLEQLVRTTAGRTFFDDEQARNALAVLLQFRDIGGPALEEALRASTNLAAFWETDLVSAARAVGGAIEDPVRGLRALGSALRNLTPDQVRAIQQMAEMGDRAGAAQAILTLLNGTIGGTAEQLNTGLKAATSGVDKAWNDFLKTLGQTDLIGGTVTRWLNAMAGGLREIDDLLSNGTGLQALLRAGGFVAYLAGSGLSKLPGAAGVAGTVLGGAGLRLGAASYQQPPADPTAPLPSFEDGDAAVGRINQAWTRAQEIGDRILKKSADDAAAAARKAREEYERTTQDANRWLDALEKEADTLGMLASEKKAYEARQVAGTLRTREERVAFMERAEAAIKLLRADEALTRQKKLQEEADRAYNREEEKRRRALEASEQAMQRELETLRRGNEEHGKSRSQIELETLAKLQLELATKQLNFAHEDEIESLERRIDLQKQIITEAGRGEGLKAQTAALQEQARLWDDIAERGSRFFTDLVTNGRSAFRRIGEEAKRFFADMVALFAKRMILQIGASATGSSALGAQAAQVGQGTLEGAASNYLSTGITTGLNYGASALGYTAGFGGVGELAAGYTANAAFIAGAAETAPVYGTIMGEIGGVLASIPVYGWIALAVVAIAAWLGGRHKGGDKFGGSAMMGFDAQGNITGDVPVAGTDNGRFFTPSQADADTRRMVRNFGSGYYAQLAAFRGTTEGMSFGLGFDHDPQGTAQSRVSTQVVDAAGNVIYSNMDRSMDDKEVPEAIALEIKRGILAALQHSNLSQDMLNILNMVVPKDATSEQIDAVLGLATAFQTLGDTIAALEGGPLVALEKTLEGLDRQVDVAQRAFTDALKEGDPKAVLQTEQELEKAIINRYRTEMEMVLNLQRAIDDLKQAAYEFSLSIAQRIVAAGGSADIAGMAMNRATFLRGQIGGDAQPERQTRFLQQYVSSIDTWYQTRRQQIVADVQEEARMHAAAAAVQQSVIQAQIGALNHQLELAQQWQSVLDKAGKMLDQMRLTAVNPLGAAGRYGLAGDDAEAARAAYLGASGGDRARTADRYLDALNTQLGLLPQAYQRGSTEYEQAYNAIMRQVAEVRLEAKPQADRVEELQRHMAGLQEEANRWASASFDVETAIRERTASLDQEFIGYMTWAQTESERLYNLQVSNNQDQLDAITGGRDVQVYMAEKQKETVDLLRDIRAGIRDMAATRPAGSTPAPGTNGAGSSAALDKRFVWSAMDEYAPRFKQKLAQL